jgi:hypothetical protein
MFLPGNSYILAAYPKIGKTILAMNLAWGLARRGIKSLFFCLEMSPEEVAAPLLHHVYRTDAITEEHWNKGLGDVSRSGFLFARNRYGLGRQAILEGLREEVHVRGIQFLVIDNFHFLTRGAKDTTAEEASASLDIKILACDLKIPILLIVHPRKTDREERMPTFQDLRGTAALAADASAVIVLIGAVDRGELGRWMLGARLGSSAWMLIGSAPVVSGVSSSTRRPSPSGNQHQKRSTPTLLQRVRERGLLSGARATAGQTTPRREDGIEETRPPRHGRGRILPHLHEGRSVLGLRVQGLLRGRGSGAGAASGREGRQHGGGEGTVFSVCRLPIRGISPSCLPQLMCISRTVT